MTPWWLARVERRGAPRAAAVVLVVAIDDGVSSVSSLCSYPCIRASTASPRCLGTRRRQVRPLLPLSPLRFLFEVVVIVLGSGVLILPYLSRLDVLALMLEWLAQFMSVISPFCS
jgi:hypothetical protein